MKNTRIYLLIFTLLLVVTSCKQRGRGVLTPTSSGRPYEILVVIDDKVREGEAGKALFEVLRSNVPGLPQPESSFKPMFSTLENFTGILKPIRNIIVVLIDPTMYTEAKFNGATDVYAFPQSVLTIQAPSEETFKEYVETNGQAILDYFTRAEMSRQMHILEKNHSQMISNTIREKFGCEVWLPSELTASKDAEDFFWVGTNDGVSDRYFVMYSLPYHDSDAFTQEYFFNKRDSVMKVNIPGEAEGMYMKTVREFTKTKIIDVQGEYTLEARGLWQIHNDQMGGPFVSHMRLDKLNNKLIIVEAFVYAPEKFKRNLMRHMEASLYTLRLPESLQKATEDADEEDIKENLNE